MVHSLQPKGRKFYNAFNVYRRELAPGTVSLTGDRAQSDDSKHWAYSSPCVFLCCWFLLLFYLYSIRLSSFIIDVPQPLINDL